MSWLEALVCRRRALVFWLILWLGMLRGMLRRMLGMLRIGLLHVQFMGTLCLVLVHLRRIVAGRRMECFLGRRRLLPHMRHLWLVVSLRGELMRLPVALKPSHTLILHWLHGWHFLHGWRWLHYLRCHIPTHLMHALGPGSIGNLLTSIGDQQWLRGKLRCANKLLGRCDVLLSRRVLMCSGRTSRRDADALEIHIGGIL
mmetsp:Transcript_72928/g.118329  ORF Transcript_72928/g.118329 Transcript_72928/m.118329 type:complete len:200 (+) Transcript_72928:346-945(+)